MSNLLQKGGESVRARSHKQLGKYLVRQYFCHAPRRYIAAFLLGCTEPDKNPATYLKGSLRCRWLRGHNWGNAQRYIERIATRLENRDRLKLLDFYTMGKLIHYTADAFTSAHNDHFTSGLQEHRHYEKDLQRYFLAYLDQRKTLRQGLNGSVIDAIRSYHKEYAQLHTDIHTDCRYAVAVASLVVCMLLAKSTLHFPVPGF